MQVKAQKKKNVDVGEGVARNKFAVDVVAGQCQSQSIKLDLLITFKSNELFPAMWPRRLRHKWKAEPAAPIKPSERSKRKRPPSARHRGRKWQEIENVLPRRMISNLKSN